MSSFPSKDRTEHDASNNQEGSAAPMFEYRIGKTVYKVTVHFSSTSKETMSDKIKRMLKNEIQNGSY